MKNEGLSQEFEGSLTVKSLNQWKNKIEIIGYKLETDNNQKNQQENTERQLKMIENKIFKQEMLENYNFKVIKHTDNSC